jgi:hypothetical protein
MRFTRLLAASLLIAAACFAQTRPWVERTDWDAELTPLRQPCAFFPAAYYAARGEVKVTQVTGNSRIRVGDTQQINPGAFLLDQFSPEKKDFTCDMIFTFVANKLKGAVSGSEARLTRVVEGRLTNATLTLSAPDLRATVVGTAEPGTQITREGQLHAIPMGFASSEQFTEFGAIMSKTFAAVLRKVRPSGSAASAALIGALGGDNTVLGFAIGSSVKGRSAGNPAKGKEPGVPFDGKSEPSDIDVNVVSPKLFKEGADLGCNVKPAGKDDKGRTVYRISENCEELEGRERTKAARGYPELAQMRETLGTLLTPNMPDKFKGQKRPVNYVVVSGRLTGIAEIRVPGM